MRGAIGNSGVTCVFAFVLIIGLILLIPVAVVLVNRHVIEKGYNRVEIVADYYQLAEVADSYNSPVEGFLTDIADAGIEGIALLEDTPHNLEMRGLCYVIHGNDWVGFHTMEERKKIKALGGEEPKDWDEIGIDLRLAYGLDPAKTHLVFTDADLGRRVGESALFRYDQRSELNKLDDLTVVSITGEERLVYELGLGFNTDLAERIAAMGFRVVPRLRNDRFFSAEVVADILDEILTDDAFQNGVIFEGDEVLGYPGNTSIVAETLRDNDAWFGWVEMAKQGGEKNIAAAIPELTVRVHSIEDKEMEKYSESKAIARFNRAVRERGCRLVYLKPFRYPQGSDNIGRTVSYFANIRKSVEAEGMVVTSPSMFSGGENGWKDPSSTWARVIITFYVFLAATYILLIGVVYRYKWIGLIPVFAAIIALIIFIAMPDSSIGRSFLKTVALLSALVFPVIAIFELVRMLSSRKRSVAIGHGIALWGVTVFIAILGGLIIAALLSERDYMLQISAYSGVKLSLVLPILAALVLGVRLVMPPDRAQKGIIENIKYLLEFQVQIKHVAAFAILAGAGLLILMRSGNQPLVGVGELEFTLRAKMEALFYARPRTKEFLIGHPLLLAGILWHLRRRPVLGYLGIVGGSVGLASVVNTFCHIHIPIGLSVLRTFWGCALGLALGLVLFAFVEIILHLFGYSYRKETLDVGKKQ